jgi:transcriptional regulator with XRE-family HTH domain
MARPEAPIDYTVPELGRLAEHLRAMRSAARLTYADLASSTGYSAATLKRAASGKSLPALAVTATYGIACVSVTADADADADAARRVIPLREEAAAAVGRARRRAHQSTVLPKPQYARDLADLSGALRDAWRRAGRPPSRAMEKAADSHLLPRTTANSIANGHTVPRDFRQFAAFLAVCEVANDDPADWLPWFRAWFKICGRPTWQEVRSVSARLPSRAAQRAYWYLLLSEADDVDAAWSEVSDIIAQVTGTAPQGIPLISVDRSYTEMGEIPPVPLWGYDRYWRIGCAA